MNKENLADSLNYDMLNPLHSTSSLRFVRGEGASYYTDDGKEYVDLNEIRLVLGQNNHAFNQAMIDALCKITTMRGENYAKAELLEYLNRTTHGYFAAAHLTSSGTETAENAVRIARKMTGKTELLSFWNSIHGRGILSGSMSGVPRRKAYHGPLPTPIVPNVLFARSMEAAIWSVSIWLRTSIRILPRRMQLRSWLSCVRLPA